MSESNFSKGPWFVYMIECRGGSLYTGIAKDPVKRFKMHLSGRGAKYTKIYKPISLVFVEEHSCHRSAFLRECQIKRFSTIKKRTFIQDKNIYKNII
ncbi:MAG: GIY-YIG nuclease family protein [Brevinemataceae bacterium]